MSLEFDPNAVAAQVISDRVSAVADFVVGKFRSLTDKAGVQLRLGVREFLEAQYSRLSRTKTLLYRDRPIAIESIYVEVKLRCGPNVWQNGAFFKQAKDDCHVVVTGTAGSGKSMLMKHLFLRCVKGDKTRLPVFLELRHMNSLSEGGLVEAIREVGGAKFPFSSEQMIHGLSLGLFTFFFDGFDEVNFDLRDRVAAEILNLVHEYPQNQVIVSSRPDETLNGWTPFHVYEVLAFEKPQVVELIRKLEYDPEVKDKFVSEVERNLFDTHEEFLSNPLLATMMLLTYDQFADIPSKIHVFYQQAFETLFQKHDALKSVYRRKIYTGLSIDEFKKFFACFSALSYFAEKFALTDDEAREFVSQALAVSGVEAGVNDCLRDMQESVCVLQRDGLQLTFVHRSFQEYFTSYFIVALNADQAGVYLDHIALRRRSNDSAINMAFDMNRDIVEAQWALPKLKAVADKIGAFDDFDLYRTLEGLFKVMYVDQLPANRSPACIYRFGAYLSNSHEGTVAGILLVLYQLQIWRSDSDFQAARKKDTAILEEMISGSLPYALSSSFEELVQRRRKERQAGKKRRQRLAPVDIGEAPWQNAVNRPWLERCSTSDVAHAVWLCIRDSHAFVRARVEARANLARGILASRKTS